MGGASYSNVFGGLLHFGFVCLSSHPVSQAGPKPTVVCLPLPPDCWGYRHLFVTTMSGLKTCIVIVHGGGEGEGRDGKSGGT